MSSAIPGKLRESDDHAAEIQLGDIAEVRPIPRITVQCFCETDLVRQTLETAAGDRRMSRTHISVNLGGIAAAVQFYQTAPTPNLIVVESQLPSEGLMQELGQLAEVCDTDTRVIVIGHYNDILLYRQLIGQGISDYLVAPVTLADIMSSISSIFTSSEDDLLGRMTAFIGAKGGAGSSTICHNVAWSISEMYQNEVVLVDLDLAFGTANMNLDQDPTQGIADAVFSPERVDEILLDRLLAQCAEHLSLLAAPSTLERTYDFEATAFSSILELTQKTAPSVIVDIPNQWNGWTKQVLAAADEVVVTAEPELANLRNAKNLIDTISEIRPNDDPCKLVVNKVGINKRPEIGVNEFAGALGLEAAAVIAFDPALFGTAANNGQMIAEADPKHAIAESLRELSQFVSGKSPLSARKKGAFSLLDTLGLAKRKSK